MSRRRGRADASGGGSVGLVVGNMFTPGRAGGRDVLVWEGRAAAGASGLGWHADEPVEVVFHTGRPGSRARTMPYEVTRQLDRQLQALSLLSVERVLEGIEAYREHGRAPMPTKVTKARQDFERQVVRDLKNDYGFSDGVARERVADVVGGLVVLHESDQVTYGPGGPGVVGGYPSLGADGVNGSIGGQNKSAVRVLEEACRGVDPRRRAGCRLLIRAVLTDSAPLAGDLRSGRLRLEVRSVDQQRAVSPRAPPWTPGKIAADIHAGRHPTDPPPPPPAREGPVPPPPAREGPAVAAGPAGPGAGRAAASSRGQSLLAAGGTSTPGQGPTPTTGQQPDRARPPHRRTRPTTKRDTNLNR